MIVRTPHPRALVMHIPTSESDERDAPVDQSGRVIGERRSIITVRLLVMR